MRTVIAAAAAGALVLGSAGGAMAHPGKSDKAKGPKMSNSAPVEKLQGVNIKRHKKIDLADVSATTALKLRASVHNSKKVGASDARPTVGLTLAVYDKKVNGTMVAGSESEATDLALKERKKAKRNQFYAGSAVISQVWTPGQVAALASQVSSEGKAFICISGVTEDFDKYSLQTRKRLGANADGSDLKKKTVRDCVKVVNSTK